MRSEEVKSRFTIPCPRTDCKQSFENKEELKAHLKWHETGLNEMPF